jgi:hypothetical protein
MPWLHFTAEGLIGIAGDGSVHRAGAESVAFLGSLGEGISTTALSPDRKRILVGRKTGNVDAYDAVDLGPIWGWSGHEGGVRSLAWSPDGRRVASGADDDTAIVRNAGDGSEIVRLRGATAPILALAFDEASTRLATLDASPALRFFAVPRGLEVFSLRGLGVITYSPGLTWQGDALLLSHGSEPVVRLEIAPPSCGAAARARFQRARALVNRLFGSGPATETSAGVIERLRRDQGLEESLRNMAIAIATARGDDLNRMNGWAWEACVSPESHPYRAHALMQIRFVCGRSPGVHEFVNTLALAEHRNGLFAEACRSARESIRCAEAAGKPAHPTDWAILTMASARLGKKEEADVALAKLRESLSVPRFASDVESKALAAEAEALVLSLR